MEFLFCLALGRKFRSPEIYMDALRHIVSIYDLTGLLGRSCVELSMGDSDSRVIVYDKREKIKLDWDNTGDSYRVFGNYFDARI